MSPGYRFYYGYEFGRVETEDGDSEEVWGFEYKKQDKSVFRVSYEEMAKIPNCPDKFECYACLLFGIGVMLSRVTTTNGS